MSACVCACGLFVVRVRVRTSAIHLHCEPVISGSRIPSSGPCLRAIPAWLALFCAADANGVDIARAGGVELVAAALRRHADHAGVAEAACGALASIALNGA